MNRNNRTSYESVNCNDFVKLPNGMYTIALRTSVGIVITVIFFIIFISYNIALRMSVRIVIFLLFQNTEPMPLHFFEYVICNYPNVECGVHLYFAS